MADPAWPSTLPQEGALGGSGAPQANVVSFQPDVGPSIDRRRASVTSRTRDVTLPMVTATQLATFKTFFHDTLFDGVLPFTWVDPMTSAASRLKFVQSKEPYKETRILPGQYSIEFQVMTLR